MRLFVAVELGEAVLKAADIATEELRKRIGRSLNPAWVPPANRHVTVRFIGHVADERVTAIMDALRPPLTVAPFDVALSDCGVFPPHGPPRVLWIGLSQGLPSLQEMHEEFNRRLLPFGFEPETRAFSAHLTLARIKDAPRGSGATVREAIHAVHLKPARGHISEAIVFESRLSPRGSTYFARLRIPLRP